MFPNKYKLRTFSLVGIERERTVHSFIDELCYFIFVIQYKSNIRFEQAFEFGLSSLFVFL